MPRTVVLAFLLTMLAAPAITRSPLAQVPPVPVAAPMPLTQVPGRDPNQVRNRAIPVGTGAITGSVLAADTGRPIARARVVLSGAVTTPGGQSGGAPTPGVATASVAGGRGTVINGVQLSGNNLGLSRVVATDAQGQFAFQKVPAGLYTISASRDQYLSASYGQKRPGRPGTPVGLAEGQKMSITLPMTRGGVITGVVIGENGDPVVNAQVRAMRYDTSSGFRRLQQVGYANTDDRGVYRMFGLQPGEYLVAATPNASDLSLERSLADADAVESAIAATVVQPPTNGVPMTINVPMTIMNPVENGPPAGYTATYYPSATSISNAATVTVNAGEERPNVDVAVQYMRAMNVQGTVIGAPQVGGVQISLATTDPSLVGALSLPGTRAGQDGKFVLRNVPPGQYTVYASTMPQSNITVINGQVQASTPVRPEDMPRLWGRSLLTVDGQNVPQDLVLTMQPGRSISGRVVFETTVVPDLSRTRVMVSAQQAPSPQQIGFGSIPQAQVTTDGRFQIDGVPPGRYIIRASMTGGTPTMPVVEKSAVVNGQDTLDEPLDFSGEQDAAGAIITMSDRLTELSGVLSDGSGKPATDYTILVVSADQKFWMPGSRRIQTSRPGPDGKYQFRNLAAGDYMIAAVLDFEQGTQYDPEFLKAFASASMRITLTDGAKRTQDLRVAR